MAIENKISDTTNPSKKEKKALTGTKSPGEEALTGTEKPKTIRDHMQHAFTKAYNDGGSGLDTKNDSGSHNSLNLDQSSERKPLLGLSDQLAQSNDGLLQPLSQKDVQQHYEHTVGMIFKAARMFMEQHLANQSAAPEHLVSAVREVTQQQLDLAAKEKNYRNKLSQLMEHAQLTQIANYWRKVENS